VIYFADSFQVAKVPPMPPIKRIARTGLPDKERAVCARLREVRQHLRLTQTEFAVQIGISRERLASYEDARAPVRADVGLRACRQFVVSEKWLATGFMYSESKPVPLTAWEAHFTMDLIREFKPDQFKPRQPFGAAYQAYFSPKYEQLAKALLKRGSHPFPRIVLNHADDLSAIKNAFDFCICTCSRMLGPQDQKRLFFALIISARVLWQELSEQVEPRNESTDFERALSTIESENAQEWFWGYQVVRALNPYWNPQRKRLLLTNVDESVKTAPVKSQLRDLLADLNQLTKESGKKTELAAFLGAPLASVSRWLSGEREPGGEIALLLRRWADDPELHDKQESPGRVSARPRPKAQVSKSGYEKPTQVRKKE
jgi:transcriptional regulator with XRE-family HTH domain